MPTRPKIVLIAARAANGVIGIRGKLPWIIREDLMHFKRATVNKPMILGRRTFQSMPAVVWISRNAFVLTRHKGRGAFDPNHHSTAHTDDLERLIELAWITDNLPVPEIVLAGGAEVYKLALEAGLVDEMLISEVHQHYIGDVYFPAVPEGMFDEGTVEAEYPEFKVVRYRRIVQES